MVQKAPSSTVGDLATALLELFEADNAIEIIGTRHGEKKAETLLTREKNTHNVKIWVIILECRQTPEI